MRFSLRPTIRSGEIMEVARECASDRDDNKAYNADLRSLYTMGSSDGSKAPVNKLQDFNRQLAAYLYQSESVRLEPRFTTQRYGDQFVKELAVFRDEIHAWYHDSKAGLEVALGCEWAGVYPTVVWKVIPSAGEPRCVFVPDPADIGVREPDRGFDQQEAKIHFYYMTLSRLNRLLDGHPKQADLMKIALGEAETGDDFGGGAPAAVERIQFDTVGQPLSGGGVPVAGSVAPIARVETPRVLMAELWFVDDRVADWRVATCLAAGGELHAILFERKNTTGVAGIDPFVKLTLAPAPDYWRGFSKTDDASGLQDETVDLKAKMRRAIDLGLRPPTVIFGVGGLREDRARRMVEPNAVTGLANPNGKLERLTPQLPQDTFAYMSRVDREFAERLGMSQLFMGSQGEEGVRSNPQLMGLARLASPQLIENQSRVKFAVSEIATLAALMMREMHDEPLMKPDGQRFLLRSIPREIAFLATSTSVLDEAAVERKAEIAKKAGAISNVSLVHLLGLPMPDIVGAEARRLEEAAAKRSEEVLAIQRMKAERGRSR